MSTKQIAVTRITPVIEFDVCLTNSGERWEGSGDADDSARLWLNGKSGKPILEIGCQRHSIGFWRSKRGEKVFLLHAEMTEGQIYVPLVNDRALMRWDSGVGTWGGYRDETDAEKDNRVALEKKAAAKALRKKKNLPKLQQAALAEFHLWLDRIEQAAEMLKDIKVAAANL